MVDKFVRAIFVALSAIILMAIATYVCLKSPFYFPSVYAALTNLLVLFLVMLALVLLFTALGEAYSDGMGRFAGEEKLIVGETYEVVWRGTGIIMGNGLEKHPAVVKLDEEYIVVICSKRPPNGFVKTRNKDKPFAAVDVVT